MVLPKLQDIMINIDFSVMNEIEYFNFLKAIFDGLRKDTKLYFHLKNF